MNRAIRYQMLPIEKLERGTYQPRNKFEQEGLQELAHSIKAAGVIEPILVRQKQGTDCFEIIAGERRWRASMLAGLSDLPCLIGDYSNEQTAAITLIENIQRRDLSPLEEAHGYQRLQNEFHFTQHEIALLTGKSRSHIANLLRMLTLTPFIQELLHQEKLSPGHARVLVGLEEALQISFAKHTMKHQWSVRKLEHEIRKHKHCQSITPAPPSEDVGALEQLLMEQLGTPVIIVPENDGGWLKIKYYNNDTLNGLLQRFGLLDENSIMDIST